MAAQVQHPTRIQVVPTAKQARAKFLTRLGFALLVITVTLAIIYPFYWMVMASFVPEGYSIVNAPVLLPEQFTLDTFRTLFEERPVFTWILNTLIVVGGSTLVTIPLSLLAAYSLNRFRFRGRRVFVFFILMTQLLPASALMIPLFLIFRGYGLLDTYQGITIAYVSFTLPLAIWVLWGYLQGIPAEYEEAALVDGCTPLGAFVRVTIPLALPGIAATALFIFLEGWNQYLLAYILTSSSSKWVISLGLFSFIGEYFVEIEQMMAASVVASVPALLLFAVLQRYLRGGLSLGGMKG